MAGLKKFQDDARELAADGKELAVRLAGGIQKISSLGDKDKADAQKKSSKKVFGVHLDPRSKELPLVLAKSLEYFQVKGLRHEGLFRLSGSQIAIQALKERFDAGENVDLLTVGDVHTVGSLLKLWFRELPEPLLTYELYDCFLAAAAITPSEGGRHAAKSALKALPPCHYLTVKHLMAFLDLVQRDAEVNKMTPSNLALVFAPNLLRPAPTGTEEDAILMLQDTPMANRLLEMFVQYYEELFEDTKLLPAYAAPVSEPQKKIDFIWRSSRPPTNVSPLAGYDMAAETMPAYVYMPPAPASAPSLASPSSAPSAPPTLVSVNSAPNLSSPGIVQSVYFGAPPDLSQYANSTQPQALLSPSRDKGPLPKAPAKPQPAAQPAIPKRPTPATLSPPPPPSSSSRPSLPLNRSGSSSGVTQSTSSSSVSTPAPPSPPSSPQHSAPQKVSAVHRRSRSTETPPQLPARSTAVQSYSNSARFGNASSTSASALPQAGTSVPSQPNGRVSVKQLKQSFGS